MPFEESLASYLEGCSFDSQGCFTLDSRGPAQGSQGSDYLLRVIQAAVAGGARRIDIKTGRDRLEVRCNLAQAPSADQLAQALRKPLENQSSVSLTLLVRALFQASLQPIEYLIWTRSGRGVVIDANRQCSLLDLPCRYTLLQVCFAASSQSFWQRLRRLPAPEVAQATRLLALRCRYAPVPIRLDGRLLNHPTDRPKLPKKPFYMHLVDRWVLSRKMPELLLAPPHPAQRPARYYDLDDPPAELKLGQHVFLQQWRDEEGAGLKARIVAKSSPRTSPDQLILHQVEDSLECTTAVGLQAFSRAPLEPNNAPDAPLAARAYLTIPGLVTDPQSWVEVVFYGVSLQPVPVDLGVPGAHALVAAPELQTDFSGIKVLEDDAFRRILYWLQIQLKEMERQSAPLEAAYKRLHGPIQTWK